MAKRRPKRTKDDPQLASLTSDQRAALAPILARYKAGRRLAQRDVGGIGLQWARVPRELLADIMHVTVRTTHNWETDGCPRNADGSFDLFAVHKWILDAAIKRATPADDESLNSKKLRADIAYREAQIQKLQRETIARSEHDAILTSRASSLRSFMEQTMPLNAYHFVNLNLDEARSRLLDLATEMMGAWTNAGGAPV